MSDKAKQSSSDKAYLQSVANTTNSGGFLKIYPIGTLKSILQVQTEDKELRLY